MDAVSIGINTTSEGLCVALRASYAKCGYVSMRLHTGMGITGVATYRKDEL